MLTDTINKVKAIQFDSTNLNAYNASLRGLSETQARVVLSSSGLDKAQQKQILNNLNATKSTISLTSAEATEALTKKLGSQQAANDLLVKAKLITYEEIEKGVTIELTSELIKKKVALGLITQEEGEQLLAAFGLTGGNVGLATSFKLLGKEIATATLQMLKWLVTTPVGMLTLIAGGLTVATLAIGKYNEKLEENRQEMIAAGKEAAQLTKDLDGLVDQYRKLGEDGAFDNSDREQAKNIEQQINELLGEHVGYIDLANGSYEEQLKLLQQLQHQKANETYADKKEAKDAAEDSLRSKINNVGVGNNISKSEMDAIEKLSKLPGMSKYLKTYDGDNKGRGKFAMFNVDVSSIDAMITSYDKMVELRNILSKSYEDEIKNGGSLEDFYNNLTNEIDDLSDAVQKYKEAIADYDLNEAVIQFNETDFGGFKGSMVESEEQLKSWITAMLNAEDVSDGVKQNLIGLANTYFPNYKNAIKETTKSHIEEKAKSLDAQSAMNGEVSKLYELGKQSGLTNKEIIDLISTQIIFNNTSLNITGKVQALAELATQLGVTTSAAIGLNNALAGNTDPTGRSQMYNTAQAYGVKWDVKGWSYNGTVYKSMGAAIQAAMAAEARGWVGGGSGGNGNGNGGGSGGGGNGGGSSKDDTPSYEDPTDAIINRINLRADELKQQEEQIENAIEIAELEKDYEKQISSTNDLIATRKQRVDELNKANAELHNEAEKLRNSTPQWNEEEWFNSQGEETEAYIDFINRRIKAGADKEEIEAIKDQFEKISKIKEAWADNDEEIAELNKEILQDAENINDIYTNLYDENIRNIEHDRDMVLNNNPNANVNAYWKQLQAEYHKEAERLRALDPEKYKEQIQELQQLWWDAQQEMLDGNKQVVEDFLDELQEKMEDDYDIRISRLNSQSSLLSSHFDIVNAINEEQHNLNKELIEAETIGARMNEQERETLFTKQEHAKLSAKLNDIMGDVNDLQSSYTAKLSKATKDTIEEITNNYERQYELKMKEYEVVKAELSLAKAQQQLENAKNEKSVRTWTGSGWSYTYVLQDVLDAQVEAEDARYEVLKAKTEESQQTTLNAIDASADALQTEKNKLSSAIEEMAEAMSGSGKEITDMLQIIAETDLPTFDAIIGAFGDSIKKAANISDEDINKYRSDSAILATMKARSEAWHTASDSEKKALADANARDGEKLDLTRDDSGVWRKKDGSIAYYASGTSNAKKGLGAFDDKKGFGSEVILTNDGILTQFNGGERVFSPEMADRLWEMAQQNYTFAPMITQPDFGKLIPIEDKINNAISNISNAFGDTYMIKDVQLNESEGGTLKGFMDFLKKKI